MRYLTALQEKIAEIGCGQIASVIGRYYAMDRDKRWGRTKLAYDLLVKGEGEPCVDAIAALKQAYERGLTDEFVTPISVRTVTGNRSL